MNEQELEELRQRYEKRVVNAYLKGRLTDLEKVLSSTSWRQAMYEFIIYRLYPDLEKNIAKKLKSFL